MGRKKKFIDKKKSATFQLFARDTSSNPSGGDPDAPPLTDRVFVRVDNNPYSTHGFLDDGDCPHLDGDGPDSIFADAPGESDDDDDDGGGEPSSEVATGYRARCTGSFPDHIRRDILELGFPDDGYNYLLHLREIKNSGGGSAYYHNSKAKLDSVPLDVKAYDASRLLIGSEVEYGGAKEDSSIYAIASKTVGVKIHRVMDPDVARLLDDSDLSRFGSDVEDLEEDFVVRANLPEELEDGGGSDEKGICVVGQLDIDDRVIHAYDDDDDDESVEKQELDFGGLGRLGTKVGDELGSEKPRVRRLLDEQFDLLTLREYDDGSDSDGAGSINTESLAVKLNDVFKEMAFDNIELEDKYKVPGDFLQKNQESNNSNLDDSYADVIRRCTEYAEMYCRENQYDKEVIIFEESSDESEVWDCETIISTYSNLDNHPGQIQAPHKTKKKLSESLTGAFDAKNNVIALGGREKLPVNFLPHNRKASGEKVIKAASLGALQQKRPQAESKEEKRERKASVKEERREARRAKKELKAVYRCEAQKAQKTVAISGPSSIHLL